MPDSMPDIMRETMQQALQPTAAPAWVLDSTDYDPLREAGRESQFAISNGFLGVRATRAVNPEARAVLAPCTYVAGLFDTPATEHPLTGLVPAADWLAVRILLPDGPLAHRAGDRSAHRRTLDMKRGMLLSAWHQSNLPAVAMRLQMLRLVSQADRAIGLQLILLEIDEGDVELTLEASIGGTDCGLIPERLEPALGLWRTLSSGKRLAIAAAATLRVDGCEIAPGAGGGFRQSWTWTARPGQVVCFERSVAIVRADTPDADPARAAGDRLGAARRLGWRGVLAAHTTAWAERWRLSDVEVQGDDGAQQALRFALYHLDSAANPDDDRVSIAARGLTGDDYHGHVFWDTEIYLLPFYTLTWPAAARAMLMYRFRTLDAARAKAVRLGWRGALYAWESADTGAEMTPEQAVGPDRCVLKILCGTQEQHISADVAYAVWHYWQATADEGFLLQAGAEILLETARFWASRAQPEADGRHHIRGVIGPDEYHEAIDDNAYTNVMARWNIRRALDIAALLQSRWPEQWTKLAASLGLEAAELQQWRTVADSIATGYHPETGLFEQMAGYFGLEDIDLGLYAGRSVPMDVVLGRERTQASQVVKQADVVALLGLLPDEFPAGSAAKNFAYYEPRCGQGSSLSRAMHGLAAARLGQADMALRFSRDTAAIDLADTHVTADGGVHIAALSGLWLIAILGFAGLSLQPDALAFDPRLPPGWRSLAFPVQWRGRRLRIRIDQADHLFRATLEDGAPMTLVVGGTAYQLGGTPGLVVTLGAAREPLQQPVTTP